MIGPGSKLAHYEIVSALGKGGMGEVWRARDTKLGREVAIKTLPAEFAEDRDRLARFEREAKLLASLNHPNIAAIYGLEEHEGSRFLVLELVEGETLAERLKHGAIPVEDSLKLALQIAEALEAAHEKGVIHRDLKPANIKVTPDGKMKVLDFGLAKAFAGNESDVNLSNSPTISLAATRQGVILGTAAYMSPEQAKGRSVDKRTDVWAFGCVLYEMLAGRPVFAADDVSTILARVLEREPDLSVLKEDIHPGLADLLTRCLQKNSRARYHDIADVRLDMEKLLSLPLPGRLIQPGSTGERPILARALILALVSALIGAMLIWFLRPHQETVSLSRLVLTIPPGVDLEGAFFDSPIAISPDGKTVAYGGTVEGTSRIYVRPLDSLTAQPVPGTESSESVPFFDPSGEWIAWVDQNGIYRARLDGREQQVVCTCLANLRGVSWGPDDTIVYSPSVNAGGIWRVSAFGGDPEPVTTPDEGAPSHRFPQLLEGGRLLIYTEGDEGRWDTSSILAYRLDRDEPPVRLVEGATYGRYLPSGHLIYFRNETLVARPLNLSDLEFTGPEARVVESVSQHAGSGAPLAAVSDSGSLVYVRKSVGDAVQSSSPTWIDRDGAQESLEVYRSFDFHALSPDGNNLALHVRGPTGGIWIHEIDSGNTSAFLTGSDRGSFPTWLTAHRMVFEPLSAAALFWRGLEGDEGGELLSSANAVLASSASPDGDWIAYTEVSPDDGGDIWVLPIHEDGTAGEATPFVQTSSFEGGGRISPDGEWIAYTANRGSRDEVYVQKFPEGSAERQISSNGGREPVWGPLGSHELFYLKNGEAVPVSVGVTLEPTFAVTSSPMELGINFGRIEDVAPAIISMYSVSADGRRFLVLKNRGAPTEPTPIVVVQNWLEYLNERVPPGSFPWWQFWKWFS